MRIFEHQKLTPHKLNSLVMRLHFNSSL